MIGGPSIDTVWFTDPVGGGVPSSLLFAGLVATWLAVLVPMAARRRQPMKRPSDAALSSRVLARPPREQRDTEEGSTVVESVDVAPRYRPGRGGFDAEAAALAAQARYTFRQRVVLVLVLLAIASALVAVGLVLPEVWWVHGAVDLILIGYLVNLRRQVRHEQLIRARRAARQAGSRPGQRRTVQRGSEPRPASRVSPSRPNHGVGVPEQRDHSDAPPTTTGPAEVARDGDPGSAGYTAQRADDIAETAAGTALYGIGLDEVPALPPLTPVSLPPCPAGTEILELDDEDPELHDLDHPQQWGYRRAAGQ